MDYEIVPPSERNDKNVLIAMSGGVDSSVAAAILKDEGYTVTGVMFSLWSVPGKEELNKCCTPDAVYQARRVAAQIGIPFYVLDAKQIFKDIVVQEFIDGYRNGITPNPCYICNKKFRWSFLMKQADAFGINYIATGHYAQIIYDNGMYKLKKGLDDTKDQSYMLSGLNQEALSRSILPLGVYRKYQIREFARSRNIIVADKPDSQDLCFLGDEDYRSFIYNYAPETIQPGPIVDNSGFEIGKHKGLANFTSGQRKKIGISSAEPLYVIRKDLINNKLIVGPKNNLFMDRLFIYDINWVSDIPATEPFEGNVKLRYRSQEIPATIEPLVGTSAQIIFREKVYNVSPGQIAVVYYEDEVICSGIISSENIQGTQP